MTAQTKHTPTKRNKLQPQSQPAAKANQLKPLAPTQAIEPAVLLQRAMTDPAKLVPAEVLSLQRMVGNRAVHNIIQRKLGESFAHAKTRHDADRQALVNALQAGLTQTEDTRLKNSCEWVMQGSQGKKLFAMTKTHDSFTRARRAGRPLGDIALFPNPSGTDFLYANGALKTPPQYYNGNDKSDQTNIYWEDEGIFGRTEGLQLSEGVAVISAAKKSQAAIWETLRHEVQHAADYHKDSGSQADQWYEGFKTEFRAYSLEGSELKNLSMTKQVKKRGYTWTERQYAIFSHIYSGYPHTQKGWDENPKLSDGRSFRQAVVDFKLPYSPNPQNSVRVDKFLDLLYQFKPNQHFKQIEKFKLPADNPSVQETKQKMADLLAAINGLDPVEKRVILSNPAIKLQDYLVDLAGGKDSPTEELPPDYVPFVEKTGASQDGYVEFQLLHMGKFYWAKDADLEEYLYGHLFGRATQKLVAFIDPPPAKIAYLYHEPLLSKAYTQVKNALHQGAAAKLPPPEEIFG